MKEKFGLTLEEEIKYVGTLVVLCFRTLFLFTTTPFVPYDEGDLWLYNKDLYVCKTPKKENEVYNANDFEKPFEQLTKMEDESDNIFPLLDS